MPPEEQIENSSLYFEPANQTWFLFTNHIGLEGLEYTDAVWVYWTKDLNRWNADSQSGGAGRQELHLEPQVHRPALGGEGGQPPGRALRRPRRRQQEPHEA